MVISVSIVQAICHGWRFTSRILNVTNSARERHSQWEPHIHKDICPMVAMLGYLVEQGSLLGRLFKFADGHYLTCNCLVSALRAILGESRINPQLYVNHNFHIRAATTEAHRGMQDFLIKILGHWDSSAYMTYIHTPPFMLILVARSHMSISH